MEPLVVQGVDVLGREVGGDHRGGRVEGAVLRWVRVPVSLGSQSGRSNPQSRTASSIKPHLRQRWCIPTGGERRVRRGDGGRAGGLPPPLRRAAPLVCL